MSQPVRDDNFCQPCSNIDWKKLFDVSQYGLGEDGDSRLTGLVLGFTSGLSDDKPPTDLLPTRWIMVWYRARPEDTIYERVAILELKLKRPLEAYDLEEDLFYTFEEVKIG